ncbi:HAD family hydrolase [Streptomyces rubiginosohelvolus]|uniref:HAD family hydrolase n=1 Tax=Streptomyces rubiginosohelvolus TaxID=67362 RepID=UPI0033B4DDB2
MRPRPGRRRPRRSSDRGDRRDGGRTAQHRRRAHRLLPPQGRRGRPAVPRGRRPADRPGAAPGAARPRQRLPHKRKGAAPLAFTLSADDTVRTKPHPDPYRAAATRFGVPASACVAVEDSPDGTASAHAAGRAVLVVPSLLPVDPARGRTFDRSLEEVDLGVLSECLRRPEASGS